MISERSIDKSPARIFTRQRSLDPPLVFFVRWWQSQGCQSKFVTTARLDGKQVQLAVYTPSNGSCATKERPRGGYISVDNIWQVTCKDIHPPAVPRPAPCFFCEMVAIPRLSVKICHNSTTGWEASATCSIYSFKWKLCNQGKASWWLHLCWQQVGKSWFDSLMISWSPASQANKGRWEEIRMKSGRTPTDWPTNKQMDGGKSMNECMNAWKKEAKQEGRKETNIGTSKRIHKQAKRQTGGGTQT